MIDVVGGGPQGGARPADTWQTTLGANTQTFSKAAKKGGSDNTTICANGNNSAQDASTESNGPPESSSTKSWLGPPPEHHSKSHPDRRHDWHSLSAVALILLVITLVFTMRRKWKTLDSTTETNRCLKPELSRPFPLSLVRLLEFWTPSRDSSKGSTSGARKKKYDIPVLRLQDKRVAR